jgi:hypothetical protein
MRRLGKVLIALLGIVAAGCAPVSVETRTRPGTDLARFATVYVDRVVSTSGLPTEDRDKPFESGQPFEDAMRIQGEKLLEAKGYRLAAPEEAQLRVEIEAVRQEVARQIWSSDPDANYYVTRDVPEAIVIVHVLERGETEESWRGQAKSRLPDRDLLVGPTPEEVWMNVLAEALDRIPPRSEPRD